MSDFPSKHFQGKRYEFTHLRPLQMTLVCGEANAKPIHIHTSFSIHCFTEAFDIAKHLDHHRYTFQQELRAFDLGRYEYSLSLPDIIRGIARSKIYRASNSNYTYVAQIKLAESPQPYSIFFQLKPENARGQAGLKMYVQSAYLSPLKTAKHAQSWRFASLVGTLTGLFSSTNKKDKPKKKKTP